MSNIKVNVLDGNNVNLQVTPQPRIDLRVDRSVAGATGQLALPALALLVHRELLALQALLDLLVVQDPQALKDYQLQVLQALQALRLLLLDLREPQDLLALKGTKALLDQPDHRAFKVYRAYREYKVFKDQLERKVLMAMMARQVQQVLMVLMAA